MDSDEAALADMYVATRLEPSCKKYWQEVDYLEWMVEELFDESETRQHLDEARDLYLDGDLRNSIIAMNKAKLTMPVFAPAWNYRGMIFEGMQLLESAISCYLKAIYLNPRFWNARENLGNARKKLIEDMHRRVPEQILDEETGEFILLPDLGEKRLFGDLKIEEALPSWFYLDECAYTLQGTPGYRCRNGLSGYDPVDRNAETGRVLGIIVKKLFTGRLRTHNPIYLILILTSSFFCFFPLIQLFIANIDNSQMMDSLFVVSPILACGFAFLYNFLSSMMTKRSDEDRLSGSEFF